MHAHTTPHHTTPYLGKFLKGDDALEEGAVISTWQLTRLAEQHVQQSWNTS